MAKTYTIAYTPNCLIAVVPDEENIQPKIDEELKNWDTPGEDWEDERSDWQKRIDEAEGEVHIEEGLTLTDEREDGDEVIWSGHVSDENGNLFDYAVRRKG